MAEVSEVRNVPSASTLKLDLDAAARTSRHVVNLSGRRWNIDVWRYLALNGHALVTNNSGFYYGPDTSKNSKVQDCSEASSVAGSDLCT